MSDYQVTEQNDLLNEDIEYGETHPGSKVTSNKRVKRDKGIIHDEPNYRCFLPWWFWVLIILVIIINYGSVFLAICGISYGSVYTYFVGGDGSSSFDGLDGSDGSDAGNADCREKIWWGRVCDFFGSPSSAVHGPRRPIGCDLVAISPEPCDELTWEIVRNHFISCQSFNVLEKSTYDFCPDGGWPGDGQGTISSYNTHGQG